jgi:hypothetical protein
MVGLIWVIQLVHYPSFHYVDTSRFKKFESFHATRISCIVLPVMGLELLTSLALPFFYSSKFKYLLYANLLIVVILWLFTLLVSARIHKKLSSGYNKQYVNRLISTNWFRTSLWTIKIPLILPFLN